ncbi:aspartate--tRNA ligase [Candidatus Woesearchaeota archaeon]|nr:aspartate--tRNA ligase [Candidatus Woesearchaeota archaeon]
MKRSHDCNALRGKDSGKTVSLMGWMHKRRDHGGLIFVDLRDREGHTQIVFNPQHNKEMYTHALKLNREDVIAISGKVTKRHSVNKDIPTGDIEVFADSLDLIGKAAPLPMEIFGDVQSTEETRLKYRYLDLRKPEMQRNLKLRHNASMAAREFFNSHGFLEIETPLLIRSTPEGARDYVVPSRVNKGKFYALPQSPQIYKQILMISGVDRYYQFARCLRDEDLRQDRQPEHTQMDFEMSFVDEKEIMHFVEGLFKHIMKKLGKKADPQFPVFSYEEAMNRFGTDKPDIRFGMELIDVTALVKKSEFKIFTSAETVKCIHVEKDYSRKEIEALEKFAKEEGAKGLAWLKLGKELEGPIAKFMKGIEKDLLKLGKKGVLLFVADKKETVNDVLGKLRLKLGDSLELRKKDSFKFCWVVDFPLFEWDEDEKSWSPSHHMFSMPKKEHLPLLEKDPGKVMANLFDIVLNGTELGSGGIRIHDTSIQKKVMKIIGLKEEVAMKKFGYLLEAYKYGAPIHGGMGLGFDRLVAILCGTHDIREVIAFPKNKNAECPMDGSPGPVDKKQLDELGLK